MAYRDDGFGSGFGTGIDPHGAWEGPSTTRGVLREPSRIRREHPDEVATSGRWASERQPHPASYPGYHQGYAPPREAMDRERFMRAQPVPVRHWPEPHYLDHQHELSTPPGWRDPASYARPHTEGYGQYERGAVQGTDMGFGEAAERGPHFGKGPKGYRRSDERIREEACERIARQGWIDASDVEVTVENAVIRLTGTVATRNDKRGLEHMLDRVHGVDEIRNELRLRRDAPTAAASSRTPMGGGDVRGRENGRTSHS